jgi:hypothetical protein
VPQSVHSDFRHFDSFAPKIWSCLNLNSNSKSRACEKRETASLKNKQAATKRQAKTKKARVLKGNFCELCANNGFFVVDWHGKGVD